MTAAEIYPDKLMAEIHDVLTKYIEEQIPELKDEKILNLIPLRMLQEVYSIEQINSIY